jgi:ABC-type uncharacterized transport system substrate-binding protein
VTGRARLATALALTLLATPLAAQTQPAKAVVIGWLGSGAVTSTAARDALTKVLRDHGFAPELDLRFAEGRLERLPQLAAELVRRKPHLIVTADAVSTSAMKKETSTIPIVMAGASDPVDLNLVQSLARPGGNVTGLSSPFGDAFATKWVELLRDVVPGASRVALLWNPDIPAARRRHAQMQRAAQTMKLKLVSLEVRRAEDFEPAFEILRRRAAAGLIVDIAPFISVNASKILDFAGRARVPTVWGYVPGVRGGGLLAYGIDFVDMHQRVAAYAVKILQGAKPADLPVEEPTKFTLVINVKTAKTLGLTIPPALLLLADELIE